MANAMWISSISLIHTVITSEIVCQSGVPCVVDCSGDGFDNHCFRPIIVNATNASSLFVNCMSRSSEICDGIVVVCPDESKSPNASCGLSCGDIYSQCNYFMMYTQGSTFVDIMCQSSSCKYGTINNRHIYQPNKQKTISLTCKNQGGLYPSDESCHDLAVLSISNDSALYFKCFGGSLSSKRKLNIEANNAHLVEIETWFATLGIELNASNASRVDMTITGNNANAARQFADIISTRFHIENIDVFNAVFNHTECVDFIAFANNTKNVNVLHNRSGSHDCLLQSKHDASYYFIQNALDVNITTLSSSHNILFNATHANLIHINSVGYSDPRWLLYGIRELIATNASNIIIGSANGMGLHLPPSNRNISFLCMGHGCSHLQLYTQEQHITNYNFTMIECPDLEEWGIYCGKHWCNLDFWQQRTVGNVSCCNNVMQRIHHHTDNCSWQPTNAPTPSPTHHHKKLYIGMSLTHFIILMVGIASLIVFMIAIIIVWGRDSKRRRSNVVNELNSPLN
eukprot:246095_1